jgi:hypothetical protein
MIKIEQNYRLFLLKKTIWVVFNLFGWVLNYSFV